MEEDNGRRAQDARDAGSHTGIQHGSAAGIDPPAGAPANVNNAGGNDDPILLRPPGSLDPGASLAVHRSDTGSPLLDAERRRRANGEHAPSLVPGERLHSRSPRPVTPPAFSRLVTSEPPASPSWHQDIPGVGTNLEDLR